MSTEKIKLQLQKWRGYSAYEIAVQNGFIGTVEEWLASLKGKDGLTNALVTNTLDVEEEGYVLDGRVGPQIKKLFEQMDGGKVSISDLVDDPSLGGDGKALSAKAGMALYQALQKKVEITLASVTLSVSGWSGNQQTVSVNGVTAETPLIVTAAPDDGYIHYHDCMVRCTQADGTLTFTAEETPTMTLTANVMIFQTGVIE